MARNIANAGTGRLSWGSSSIYNLHSDMSCGFWIKLQTTSTNAAVMLARGGIGGAQAENYAFALLPGIGGIDFDIIYSHETGSGTASSNTFNTNRAYNVWQYIGMSRDATGKTVTLYLGTLSTPIAAFGTVYTYTNAPDGGTGTCELTALAANDASAQLDACDFAHAFVSDQIFALGDHEAFARGRIPAKALLMFSPVYGFDSPEPDYSGQVQNATVTSTTFIAHPGIAPLVQARAALAGRAIPTPGGMAMRRTLSNLGTRMGSRQLVGG